MAQRPLLTERLRGMAPTVGAIVAGAFIATLMPTGFLQAAVFVGTIVVVAVLASRRPDGSTRRRGR